MTRRTIELLAFIAALLLAALAFHAWLAAHDEQQRLQSTLATQKQLIDAADARERDRNAALNDTLAQITKLKATTQTPQEILSALQQYLQLPQPITLQTNPPAGTMTSKKGRASVAGTQATNFGRIAPSTSRPPSTAPQGFSNTSSLPTPASSSIQVDASPRGIQPFDTVSTRGQEGTRPSQNFPASSRSETTPASPSSALPDQPSGAAPADATIPATDLKPLYDFVQDCRACQAQLAAAKQNSADDAAKLASLSRERDAAITAAKGGTFWRRLRRNAAWLAAGAALGYLTAKR
jgi:hypothetical protein